MMKELPRDILQCAGNTSMLALRKVVPASGARILLKLEDENPTGSIKDRMALAMIEAAEADGRLTADGSVVEYTAGSTGVSLSLICAVKGYPLHIVTSDALAREKLDHIEQNNFDGYDPIRIIEAPPIEVYLVPSQEDPGGMGEPGVPPIAPAVANAIFAAAGQRLRRLPFQLKAVA
jgi:hypothetical protein